MDNLVKIEDKHLVKKRNALNETKNNYMTLQELRFFNIYLSKINPEDISTRLVRFTLEDFQNVMGLGRINLEYMQEVTNSLLRQIVTVPNEGRGYTSFQLFKRCKVAQDTTGIWYIEIDAHDEALPLMFEYKNRYFSYELKNTLYLKSENQIRMYEILKQYQTIGKRILSVEQLRELLGLKNGEYERYGNFKKRVLDSCQKELEKNTDIIFTYSPYGKRGAGGKILNLEFTILKNPKYKSDEKMDKFFSDEPPKEEQKYNGRIEFLLGAFDNIFTEKEVTNLYLLVMKNKSINFSDDIELYNYCNLKYSEMEMRNEKREIKNKYGYIKKLIESDNLKSEQEI